MRGVAAPTGGWCAIPAGTFTMGNDVADANPGDGEGPERPVTLPAFEIGATTVTNAEFAAFVRATRHVTDAERLGSSFVFHLQLPPERRTPQPGALAVVGLPWWRQVEDACWQRPAGPGSQAQLAPRRSGGACLVERCAGLLRLGRLSPAH